MEKTLATSKTIADRNDMLEKGNKDLDGVIQQADDVSAPTHGG